MTGKVNRRRRIVLLYVLTLIGAGIWLAALFAAPYFLERSPKAAGFLYACFSPVCHQNPFRSFVVFGQPMAVCARCLGIYAGFAAGAVLYPFRRGLSALRPTRLRTLLLFSGPIAVDAAANWIGLWNTPNLPRFGLGFLWGTVLPFFFIAGVGEWITRGRRPAGV